MMRISAPMKDLVLVGVLLALALTMTVVKQCTVDEEVPAAAAVPKVVYEVVRPFSEAPDTLLAMMERNQ